MKKRILSLVLAIVMLVSASPFGAFNLTVAAQSENGITYVIENGEATITDYVGSATTLTIPDSLGGYPVVAIKENAFYGCNTITTLYFNASKCKKMYLFKNDSFGGARYSVFSNCSKLSMVCFGNNVNDIPDYAFTGCTKLRRLSIPNSIKNIGDSAFSGCKSLSSDIVIPNSVIKIGHSAFSGCKNISNVSLGNNVKEIGGSAFFDCDSLKTITIPKSVTSIAHYAFNSIKKVNISDLYAWCNIDFQLWYHGDIFGTQKELLLNNKPIKNLRIPNGVKEIKKGAFSSFTNFESVYIPKSVTKINSDSFPSNYWYTDDNGLHVGKISVNVEDITSWLNGGYAAFNKETPLQLKGKPITKLVILNGVTKIPSNAFYNNKTITSVTIPDSFTEIGASAFQGCSKLKEVKLSNNIKTIGKKAFYGTKVVTVAIPKECELYSNSFKGAHVSYAGTRDELDFAMIDVKLSAFTKNNAVHYGKTTALHKLKKTTPATTKKNGKLVYTCGTCKKNVNVTIPKIKNKEVLEKDLNDSYSIENKTNTRVVSLRNTAITYNGKSQKPDVQITASDGSELVKGTDYTLTYKNNKNVGTATINIKFKGNYSGKTTQTFYIVSKAASLKTLKSSKKATAKVTWKKDSQVSGYEIQYSTSKKFKNSKSVFVKGSKTTSTTLKKLKSKKTYYIRVRGYKTIKKGKLLGSQYSTVKKVKIK